MRNATVKQLEYAEAISEELGIDMPEEKDMESISTFIDENKDDYYESRRERLGGYDELEARFERRMRGERS